VCGFQPVALIICGIVVPLEACSSDTTSVILLGLLGREASGFGVGGVDSVAVADMLRCVLGLFVR
jgi:hypothetical protein